MGVYMKIDPIPQRYISIYTAAILLLIMFFSGCAGSGTEVGNPEAIASMTGPSISNLVYSSTSGTSDAYGNEVRMTTVTGSVDFMDEDGNVSNLIIDIIDSDNYQVDHITKPIEGFFGETSGTVEFTINIDAEPGEYTFEIYIMDESNNESDVLVGAFNIF